MPRKTTSRRRRLLGRAEVAEVYGVTPQRVTRWAGDGMPIADRGSRGRESKYDLRAVNRWWLARELRARGLDGKAGDRVDLPTERAHLARVQARRMELDVKTRERELLPRGQVVQEGKAFVVAARAKILSLPGRMIQAGIIPRERKADVNALVREALEEMARWRTHLDLLDVAKGGTDDDSEPKA